MSFLWIYLTLGVLYTIYEIYEVSRSMFMRVNITMIPLVILLWPLVILTRILRT